MTSDEKLDKLIEDMHISRNWQIDHSARHDALAKEVSNHEHTLYGNGMPGLKSAVEALQMRAGQQPSIVKDMCCRIGVNVISAGMIGMFLLIVWLIGFRNALEGVLK